MEQIHLRIIVGLCISVCEYIGFAIYYFILSQRKATETNKKLYSVVIL